MPTQKVFKQRVRARMTKTGESYTTARHQLLRKAPPTAITEAPTPAAAAAIPNEALLVAPEVLFGATGKAHAEWFAILDAWGATTHTHTEIARWLRETQGVPSWWTQNITVSYERARGMRARHQQTTGYSISVTRTIAADPGRALAAFTDLRVRRTWLTDAPLRARPTRAAFTARFDWSEPASRIIVVAFPKGDRTIVSVTHERIPDPAVAERLKLSWRDWLGDLKTVMELERG